MKIESTALVAFHTFIAAGIVVIGTTFSARKEFHFSTVILARILKVI